MFNSKGVALISIREISREMKISHSNLLYHFKDKFEIINSLHEQLIEKVYELNKEIDENSNELTRLLNGIEKGFEILLDYRFMMIDFNFIAQENNTFRERIIEMEKERATMYMNLIKGLIQSKIIRKSSYSSEYDALIIQIRIFSDYWISSSQIYDDSTNPKKYAKLLLQLFYPYMTKAGKQEFLKIV